MKSFVAASLMKIGCFKEALEYCDLAILKNPENSEYYYNKGKFKNSDFCSSIIIENQ